MVLSNFESTLATIIEENVEKGRKEGMKKGVEKGRQEGMKKGVEKGRFYNVPINVDTIKEGYPILCA